MDEKKRGISKLLRWPLPLIIPLTGILFVLDARGGDIEFINLIFGTLFAWQIFGVMFGVQFFLQRSWERVRFSFSCYCAVILIFVGLGLFRPLLHLSFFVNRSSLDRIADRLDHGETVRAPLWVGTFKVIRIEPRFGKATLVLFDTETGPICLSRNGSRFNEWWLRRLSPDWVLFRED